jgi:hypothetical protein
VTLAPFPGPDPIRDHVLTLACLRLGQQRALTAAVTIAGEELRRTDAAAAARLVPMLSGLTTDA